MRYLALAVGSLVLLAGCSNFMTPGGAAAARWAALEKTRAAKVAGLTDADRICKVMPVTGSNMPKKVCSTQAEWETVERQQRESAEQFNADLRNNAGNISPGGS